MTLSRPRFTIERLRTLLLIGGGLLVVAIIVFLVGGQWTRRLLTNDLPHRLGANIESQADGVNYTQTRKGKTIFKLHAARAVTIKSDGSSLLHDVKIDLYGEDGSRTDTISGSEFEYNPKAGLATAAGAVEITMMRPGVRPAIAQLKPGAPQPQKAPPAGFSTQTAANSGQAQAGNQAGNALASGISDNEIHVKTSGLTFNQRTGVATTQQRVDFAVRQGNGNSIGATYDSGKGHLVLDRAVEIHVERNEARGNPSPVNIHAGHAEFERGDMICLLDQAKAEYSGGTAQTAKAQIHFRQDGTVTELDGSGGVDLQTKTGGHVTAPTGTLEFDENNHPRHGLLQGGTQLEMNQPDRRVWGSSPMAQLTFDIKGLLRQAHMGQGVLFNSQQYTTTAKGMSVQMRRSWKSQTADVAFAPVEGPAKAGKQAQESGQDAKADQKSGQVEPRTIHGYGGVVVTSETVNEGAMMPSKLAADTVVAELAPGGALSTLQGTGHASFEERTAAGAHQASSSDQLQVRFVPELKGAKQVRPAKSSKAGSDSEIASVVEEGHVVLVQTPASKPGQTSVPSEVRATGDRGDYDGQSEILHLTGTPRVRDGAMDMTADRIDFNRASGDAFAHGDVRASWGSEGSTSQAGPTLPGASLLAGSGQSTGGGNGPVHAIAAEAELHQATQEVTFRGNGAAGKQPRLWQSVNSVTAPLIMLNRQKQTLTAEANGPANPVVTVLTGNAPGPAGAAKASSSSASSSTSGAAGVKSKQDAPSVIRVRSGELHYSEGERVALFHSGQVGSVTAQTTGTGGTATIVSQEAEAKLLPAGTHPGTNGGTNTAGTDTIGSAAPANSSVDRLTARGHVEVDWPDRQGTGEKLVYLGEDGTWTLTGTSSAPPRITDQAQGTFTGSALIYHSRDGSVAVEGDGGKTETQTQSPKKRRRTT